VIILAWILFAVHILFWAGGLLLSWKFTHQNLNSPDPALPQNSRRFPVTFFRPIKSGIPDLGDKLSQFLTQLEPGDEILFGVTPEQKYEIRTIQSLCRPDVHIRLVHCEPDCVLNPKINKLIQLEPYATRETWVLLDAEAMPTRSFLNHAIQQLSITTAVTCMYRFVPSMHLSELADAIATTAFLRTGSLWKNTFTGNHHVFGACLIVSRTMVHTIGGYRQLGDQLADDFQIGRLLIQHGFQIHTINATIPLSSDRLTWSDFLLHQQRVAVTYRVCAGSGYFGSILTLALPCSIAAATNSLITAAFLFFMNILFRAVTYFLIARNLEMRVSLIKMMVISPLLLVTEFGAWLTCWLPLPVSWNTHSLNVRSKGTIRPAATHGRQHKAKPLSRSNSAAAGIVAWHKLGPTKWDPPPREAPGESNPKKVQSQRDV
jgi:ceramide glucosyltransferase